MQYKTKTFYLLNLVDIRGFYGSNATFVRLQANLTKLLSFYGGEC